MKYSEPVYILDSETSFKLNAKNGANNVKALYQSGSGTDSLVFKYEVRSLDATPPSTDLTYLQEPISGRVVDQAGNLCTTSLLSTLAGSRQVDTIAPTKPNITAISGIKNADQTVTATHGESSVEYRFSLDGGVTWQAWSTNNSILTNTTNGTSKEYKVLAMVRDSAGNQSVISDTITFTVDKISPAISLITTETLTAHID